MNTSTFAKTIVSHWSVIAVVAVLIVTVNTPQSINYTTRLFIYASATVV